MARRKLTKNQIEYNKQVRRCYERGEEEWLRMNTYHLDQKF